MNDPQTMRREALSIPTGHTSDQEGVKAESLPSVLRATIHSDGTVQHETQDVVKGTTANMPTDSKVFSQVRDRLGLPISEKEAGDDAIVTVPGIGTMSLASAIQAGFASRNDDGTFSKPAPGKPTETKETHPDLQRETVGDDAEKAMDTFEKSVTLGTQIAAIHDIAETGDVSEVNLARLASEMRTEPGKVMEMMDTIRPAMEQQARAAIAEAGVDPDEVFAWAAQAKEGKVRDAVKHHLTLRQTRGYKELAKEYVRNLDTINPDAILNAEFGNGVSARRDAQGQIILKDAQGREFEWQSAVLNGIVRLGR